MVGGTNNSAIAFVEVLGYKTRHKIECVANRKLEHLEEVQKMETIDADLLSSGVGLRLQGGLARLPACLFACLLLPLKATRFKMSPAVRLILPTCTCT